MGTWGAGNWDSDAALDFLGTEMDRHVRAITDILADRERFSLDEDAEGELMPRIAILTVLCEQCRGSLKRSVDLVAWKAQYLEMYDDQIDDLQPREGYRQQRRAVIEATFDTLIRLHEAHWQR
jgi:hypothetical protein